MKFIKWTVPTLYKLNADIKGFSNSLLKTKYYIL